MTDLRRDPGEIIVDASIGRHLAFSPVAFAVTAGPSHAVVYANAVFRGLQASGRIRIGPAAESSGTGAQADLTPLLDQVFQSARTARDTVVEPPDAGDASWSCTVWPVPDGANIPERLVIEVRDIALIENTRLRQREIAERLLLAALHEQDLASEAVRTSANARYLAKASRDLSVSLDETETRDTVRRLALPRPGTWCVVDVVESNGAIHRLAVVHPDPAKQELATRLEYLWAGRTSDGTSAESVLHALTPEHAIAVSPELGDALLHAAHGTETLRLLQEIGFGSMLVVPLIVRARVQGAITFVSRESEPPFTDDEIVLATDLAARCAMALDNARLYRETDALRLAAELANRSKSQFLGNMSHELRTPLNAIGGYVELMDMEIHGPVTEQQRVALARVKANQQHLLAMITEILNFVRVESGRMEYNCRPVSMSLALSEVGEMLRALIEQRELTVATCEEDAGAIAWADPARVRQILVNLAMNAVKYTPDHATAITLTCGVEGNVVFARVSDTGPGIAPNQIDSIFEPFVQLAASLANRRGGVGLGLAISRDLARAMNGDLTVHSTVGVGSEFTLTLPLATPDSSEAGAISAQSSVPSGDRAARNANATGLGKLRSRPAAE